MRKTHHHQTKMPAWLAVLLVLSIGAALSVYFTINGFPDHHGGEHHHRQR